MHWFMKFTMVLCLMMNALTAFGESTSEQEVWKLEADYWKFVKAVDLENYKNLWHANFVGWPMASAEPARKDHITDWIAAHANKGENLRWYHIEQAASQTTENIVVAHYWITMFWLDKDGNGVPSTARITHTWIKNGKTWQIVGGMSAPSAQ